LATSPPIGDALGGDTAHNGVGALLVGEPERHAIVIAEVKLTEIALQMFLAHMVIDAIDAAFEDREITLDSIGVRVATYVFAD